MKTGSSLSHVAISLLESPSEVLGLSLSSGLWVRWGQGKVDTSRWHGLCQGRSQEPESQGP